VASAGKKSSGWDKGKGKGGMGHEKKIWVKGGTVTKGKNALLMGRKERRLTLGKGIYSKIENEKKAVCLSSSERNKSLRLWKM